MASGTAYLTANTKVFATLNDPALQYVSLRTQYARKSADDASTNLSGFGSAKAKARTLSKPVARIHADCSRIYWSGQEVSVTISIDEAALGEAAKESSLDELVAEVKGEIHSFTHINQAGNTEYAQPLIVPIFSGSVTLFSRNADAETAASTMHAEPAAPKADGTRAWLVRTTLPLSFTADDGKDYPLPPTFKDTTRTASDGSSFVVYFVTAVTKRGSVKSDSLSAEGQVLRSLLGRGKAHMPQTCTTWSPILVSSFATQSLDPASLVMPPPVAAPGELPALPAEWQSIKVSQVFKKALLLDRGVIEAQVSALVA